MSNVLPRGWAKVTLGEVVEVRDFEREPINSRQRAERIAGKSHDELFPYYGATGQVGLIDGFRSEGEQVLLGEDGAPFLDPRRDKAYIVTGRYWVNNHAHVLSGIEGVMSNRLLAHQLNAADYRDFVTGSTRLKLTSAAMKRIPLLLPPPAEQNRIVEKLEELLSDLDAGVAELKAAQRKLAQYRQSLLKAAVDGTLTADWRAAHGAPQETGAELLQRILTERRARWEQKQFAKFAAQGKTPPKGWRAKYLGPVAPDLTDLPSLPEGWAWASLDMLGEIASGVAKGTKRPANISTREVPYLRVANVQRGYLDLTQIKTIEATESDVAELRLMSGDVLFNEGGDLDKLGRGWVWYGEVAECIHQNHVFRMRPILSATPSEFISHHGNSFGKEWFKRAGKQTTNLASINMTMLRAFPVPVPPEAESREIVERLDAALTAVKQQQVAIETGLAQAAAQRKNVLKAAFAGQLVPQDPNDEPASELLARLRARRSAEGPPITRKHGRKVKGSP